MDQYPHICDEYLEIYYNYVDIWKGWDGCNLRQNQRCYFGCHGLQINCFWFEHNSMFQGIWAKVITQTREQLTFYFIGVHYMTHWTNLVILVLRKLSLVMCIKGMLQSLHAIFHIVEKRYSNLWTLLDCAKTHWILMFSLLKWVLSGYKLFVMKMHIDPPKASFFGKI